MDKGIEISSEPSQAGPHKVVNLTQNYYRILFRRICAEAMSWGFPQIIAALLALVTLALQIRYGLIEHGQWKPSVISIILPYVGITAIYLAIELIQVPAALYREQINNLHVALEQIRRFQNYVSLQIGIGTVHREATEEQDFQYKYDIFVNVRLELRRPDQITVNEYKLEMDFHGMKYFPEECKDVDQWEMTLIHQHDGGTHFDIVFLTALPMRMEADRPYEGWLHFVTRQMSENQINNSRLRLFVETPLGPAYDEAGAAQESKTRRITRKSNAISVD
jgi:hypothetical protein